jgi:ABC-type sugar transport system substrate-binding protein
VVEDPFRMGYDGVKTALAASKGEKVSANVDTGVTLVTKANMRLCAFARTPQTESQVTYNGGSRH